VETLHDWTSFYRIQPNDAVRKFLKLPIVVITALTLIQTISFIPQYESAAQIDTASLQVACSRKIFGVRQWQDVLTAMPKSIQTVEMKFNFEAGNGWDDLSADMSVEIMSHLPPSIEGLRIDHADITLWMQ